MNAVEALEVLLVGLGTVLVAVGLAASALKVLFSCALPREQDSAGSMFGARH